MSDFTDWLDNEMESRGIPDRATLVRNANAKKHNLSEAVLSNIYAGRRNAGKNVCLAIAAGLGAKDEDVFRAAGLIGGKSELSDFQKRVIDLINNNLNNMTEERRQTCWRTSDAIRANPDTCTGCRANRPRTKGVCRYIR